MKPLFLAALLALGGCAQSDYFGDYHESSTVTYGMAGNSIRSDTSGYWHERGVSAPQGDVAIWNDSVNKTQFIAILRKPHTVFHCWGL